jgi:hypothetical protein
MIDFLHKAFNTKEHQEKQARKINEGLCEINKVLREINKECNRKQEWRQKHRVTADEIERSISRHMETHRFQAIVHDENRCFVAEDAHKNYKAATADLRKQLALHKTRSKK